MNKLLRYALGSLLFCLLWACSGQPGVDGPSGVEPDAHVATSALTQHVYENIATGTVCAASPRSCYLYESSGPNPPATPALTRILLNGGATTSHGTYSTLTHTATLSVTDAAYDSFIASMNNIDPAYYMEFDLYYDDTTCSPTSHQCTLNASASTYTPVHL